jgi:aminopeptidase N
MLDAMLLHQHDEKPQTTYLKDYQVPAYLIDEIHLDFDLYDDHAQVTSFMRVRHNRQSSSKSRDLILNGEELQLESIKLNGKILKAPDYQVSPEKLIIKKVPDKCDLEIVTKIFPQKNVALSGLYRSAKTFCTQCEAEGFRRITYFPDHPDVLARYTTKIRADKKQYPYLLSNGNLIESGELKDGRHYAVWEDPFKKPSYLFALVAGDFDLLEDKFVTQSGHEVKIHIYVEKGYGDQGHHAMYSVKQAMRWDEEAYGREYDLDIYMIVAIGDFTMGAMENKGLNIFNTKYVLAKPETATDEDYIHILSVVGHEYFHNWSGNRVTCRDWFQLSLKEGLTIFRDQSFSEDLLSKGVMRIRDVNYLREVQFPEDASPLAHPVRPDSYLEINNFYTATVYNKGAEVLRMLQTLLGKTQFRKGMDLYFARHDGNAVTIEDYVKTMEDVSGIDLHQFRLWYSQAGTPMLEVTDEYDAKKATYRLTIKQSCPPTPNQPIKKTMHIPVRVALFDKKGKEIPLHLNHEAVENEKVLQLTKAEQTFEFHQVPEKPVASLLRNFSAPVKLHYAISDDDLLFLFKHDTDPFNRWEAGQQFILRTILKLIKDHQQNKKLVLPQALIDIYRYLLSDHKTERLLLSEMFILPSERYIGEQLTEIDVDAIHAVREFIIHEMAEKLHDAFFKLYQTNQSTSIAFNIEDIGKRQLKNTSLSFLMRLPQYLELGVKQFDASLKSNMTDTLSALYALSNIDNPARVDALKRFYETWKQDALVMDKWFGIQGASKLPGTLNEVNRLVEHPGFDLKNPNKVYSLIGAFAHRNAIHLHAKDGAGYVFLREIVSKLDKINPQVAARMVKPLTAWKRYDKERQHLMREQLELLLRDKLSTDVYELATKSLEKSEERLK